MWRLTTSSKSSSRTGLQKLVRFCASAPPQPAASSSNHPHHHDQTATTDKSIARKPEKAVHVTVTSASVPPLVKSLLLRAVNVLSKQPATKNCDLTTHDPVSSLFLRSGSQQSTHSMEFLVDVKKQMSEAEKCPLESEETRPLPTVGQKLSLFQRIELYLALGKARLSALVVLTSSFGYGLALLSSPSLAAVSPMTHFATFTAATIGTAFLAAGANTLNQFSEAPYDSQMPRTRARPLAVRALSPEHALLAGVSSSLLGAATLALTTNPMTTALGVANCLLYAGVYTPMKRTSPYNTWVGAIVGALPPLMGWSAATGGHLDHGAYVLAGILFCWQFPHFMALSWNMKAEYARAGYQVQSVVNPLACRLSAYRHASALMFLCSVAAPLAHLAPWTFALASLPVNGYLLKLSHRFRHNPDAASARNLFRYSLIYLPTLLTLLSACSYFGK